MRILSTLSKPDAGQAWIAGKDLAREPDAVRAAIGVTGQFAAVDGLLTGFENLVLMGNLHHLGKRESRQRATELLEKFDLTEAAAKALATYSGGMRRRLDLAISGVWTYSSPILSQRRGSGRRPGPHRHGRRQIAGLHGCLR